MGAQFHDVVNQTHSEHEQGAYDNRSGLKRRDRHPPGPSLRRRHRRPNPHPDQRREHDRQPSKQGGRALVPAISGRRRHETHAESYSPNPGRQEESGSEGYNENEKAADYQAHTNCGSTERS